MLRRVRGLPLAAGLVISIALPAGAQAQERSATVTTATSEEYEQGYLATQDGRALYMFTLDQRGQGESAAVSHCEDDCAEAWPPFLSDGPPQAGPGVKEGLLGTIQRPGGGTQVTYAGWPLYRYFRDQSDEFQTHGQALETHGGYWYLLHPDGTVIEDREF
ncbi:hypothetical protein C882_2499 [Caenispirillum salinarum AK4]|uniref:Lipoprotein n=1 Tax=Caenispirillum salinarum AK4 TaxID=1238182 RepID=K9H2B6_9PROT|nr:hypothetical protein [Caenispirillum salinarum]EKV32420.1 hypothetical protein C882_2499 [Caenispirillum salinarum AK4]